MPRLAIILTVLLVTVPLGGAQAPLRPVPKSGGDDTKQSTSSASHKEKAAPSKDATPSREDAKPSKAQLAKEALAKAEAKHKAALEHADKAMKRLEDFVADVGKGPDLQAAAAGVERAAEKAIESKAQDAQKTFHGRVSDLSHAAAGASLDGLENKALEAAKATQRELERKAHEMRSMAARMRREKQAEAHKLSHEAQKAARDSLKAASALERAQRHAGAKESEYEGTFGHNEHFSESMEDHAEDLGDRAADRIEHFYEQVQDIVQDRSDNVRHEASHKAESMRQEVSQARRQGEAEAKRAEQAARAKASEGAAKAPAKASDGAAKKAPAAEKADKSDHAAHSKDSSAKHAAKGSKPSGDAITFASEGMHPAASAVLGLCGLLALSLGAGLLLSLRSRVAIREPPLLG